MDDRLLAEAKSVVGDQDCASHTRSLVWIDPPTSHGEMKSQPLLFVLTKIYTQAIVYALYDLCRHPEYIELLREEINLRYKENETGNPFEKMFLLDSFLKESARFSPSDSSRCPKQRLDRASQSHAR